MNTPTNLCKFEIHEFKCNLKKSLFTYSPMDYVTMETKKIVFSQI